MMNLDQDGSVACTLAYLDSGAERTSLISTLAMGLAKQGNDPHNQEIGLCMLEDYERTSSTKREELLFYSPPFRFLSIAAILVDT